MTTDTGPAVCEKCGKRHPKDWIHAGEQRCVCCQQDFPKKSFKRHYAYCNDCAAKLEAAL